MKKIIFSVIMMLALGVNNSSIYAQSVVRNGNTFKVESSGRSVSKADTLVTKFFFEDTKGNKYPIILNKKSGACYVWKVSKKSGKYYKQYMTAEISQQVAKEYNITYVPKKK